MEFKYHFTFKTDEYESSVKLLAKNFELALQKLKEKGFKTEDIDYASKESDDLENFEKTLHRPVKINIKEKV